MYREFFLRSPLLVFPLVALALFAAVFFSWVLRVWRRDPATFAALEQLPLDLDDGTSVAKRDGEVRP